MERELALISQYLPSIVHGLLMTLLLTLLILGTATPLALLIVLVRSTRFEVIVTAYVTFIRAMPALIIIYISFYALPQFGIRLTPFEASYYGLTAVSAAYISEDIRGGFNSIDRGQYLAATALGLPYWRVLRRITIPQALPAIAPNYITSAILTVQGTSLASLVAVTELSAATARAVAISQDAFVLLGISAGLYLAISGLCAILQQWISRRQ